MLDKKEYDYLFKLLVLESSFVGKTNMLKRFLSNEFDIKAKETVGVEFGSENFIMGKKENIVKDQKWDIAAQERYHSVAKSYYKGTKGFISI
jgi:GTPase SAR1 family protein